jgi:hypothetical protein
MIKLLAGCKLGERVALPVIDRGTIVARQADGEGVLLATVIGIHKSVDAPMYKLIVVGWKSLDELSVMSNAAQYDQGVHQRNGSTRWTTSCAGDASDWLYEEGMYEYRCVLYGHIEVIGREDAASLTTLAPTRKVEVPDWKFMQNSTPGECPCGGTRGVCPYHP